MTFQHRNALKISKIVDSHGCVNWGCDEIGPDGIKIEVKNLVSVPFENWHTLAWSNVPNSACFINRGSSTHVPSKFELSTRNLSWVAL